MTKLSLLSIVSLNVLLFSACGGGSSETSSDTPNRAEMQASISDYMNSERELQVFISEHNLDEDPEIMAINQQAFDASQAYNQFRKNLPALKALFAENDALQSEMIQAKLDGDEETYKAKMSEYITARSRIEKTAQELPEVQAAQEELQVVLDEQNEVLASKVETVNGEGKKIAETYRKLHAQFKDQR